jgi:phosphotransferase system IIB component
MSSTRRKKYIWKIEKCTKQLVLIVERNAKFLLSLQKVNQLDVKIVLERTDHNEVLAAIIVDSTIEDQEKCTKQLVLIVERNAKCHLSQAETSQLDVETVFKQLETKFLDD